MTTNDTLIVFLKAHPCDTEEYGGCSDKCVKLSGDAEKKKGGLYKCSCEKGRRLMDDKKTCEKSKYYQDFSTHQFIQI